MNNYKVGIYLRLSREDEKQGESGSISTQRELLLDYIKNNNLLFVCEYVDDGVSGTTFDRKGFNRMIRDCESKKINMIITKDTSRLGRDHIEFGYYVEKYFPEHNIRYVAVNDGIDTFNNSSNDMLLFKSAFNDMYVKDISNKLRSSLYIKKKSGLFVGCYAPYGYKKCNNDNHRLEIDSNTSYVVKRIFDMFIKGYSLGKISDVLTCENIPTPSMAKNMRLGQSNIHYGVWSTKTIDSILKNPTYMGNLTQGRQRKVSYKSKKRIHIKEDDWIVSEDTVPPIVSREVFELVQSMFKINKNHSKRGNGITDKLLFRGLVYCKECHHTIGWRDYIQNTKKNGLVHRIYGNCNYWSKRRKQNVCTPHSIKYNIIEDLVIDNLKELINKYIDRDKLYELVLSSDKFIEKKNNIKSEIMRLEQVIINNKKKIEACYRDRLDNNITIDIYKKIYNDLMVEIDKSKNKKGEYEKMFFDFNHLNNNYLDKINSFLDMRNISSSLISLLIDRIEIDEDKNIDIYYKFKTFESYSSNTVFK